MQHLTPAKSQDNPGQNVFSCLLLFLRGVLVLEQTGSDQSYTDSLLLLQCQWNN